MTDPLLTLDDELLSGTVVERPNRFVVRVRFDDDPERVFLGDPGALEGVVEPGREALCRAVADPERATDYDAIAARVDDVHVSLRAALANDLLERVLESGDLPAFSGYSIRRREPALPDDGRADFLLESASGPTSTASARIEPSTPSSLPGSRTPLRRASASTPSRPSSTRRTTGSGIPRSRSTWSDWRHSSSGFGARGNSSVTQ
jgi:hypothetical protein